MKNIIKNAIPFILVGIAVFLFITFWNPGDVRDVEEADRAYIGRDFHTAVEIYEENRKNLNKNQLMNLADSYQRIGVPERAIAIFESMSKNGEVSNEYLGQFYLGLARDELKNENIDKSREFFERSIENAQSPTLTLKIKKEYGTFISEYPTNETVDKGISYLKEISERPTESQNYINLFNLGKLYYITGQFEDAIHTWRRVLSINHQFVPAYERLGVVMLEIGAYEEAIKVFNEGINQRNRTWRLYFGLAEAYNQLGDKERALNYYNETLSFNPEHYPSHYQLSQIYIERGNRKAASEHLYIIVKNNPDSELAEISRELLEEHMPTFFDESMLE